MSSTPDPKPESAKRVPWGPMILGVVIVVVGAVLLIPSYQGFRPRSIVNDAISDSLPLRLRISEFYEANRKLPEGAEAAAFRLERDLKESQSVAWSPGERMLIVTMGDNMHRGKRFGWKAEPGPAGLEWKCTTIDLEPKNLPGNCR